MIQVFGEQRNLAWQKQRVSGIFCSLSCWYHWGERLLEKEGPKNSKREVREQAQSSIKWFAIGGLRIIIISRLRQRRKRRLLQSAQSVISQQKQTHNLGWSEVVEVRPV